VSLFAAHKAAVTSLSFSGRVRGLLASCSADKTVRVWDVCGALGPRLVAYKSMNVGRLFTLQCSPDEPFLLAAAGDKG
jgi:periodic tryptophan protein 1